MTERTTDGKRIVYAPQSTYPLPHNTTTGVISVALADNEEVEWHWSHSEAGSFVNGYTVRSKPGLCNEEFKHEILETLVSHLKNLWFPFP